MVFSSFFQTGEIVMLKDIKSMNQNIFLTVDTTCPLARCETPSTPKTPSGFEPPPTIGKKNKSSNIIIDLFWIMHPTSLLGALSAKEIKMDFLVLSFG